MRNLKQKHRQTPFIKTPVCETPGVFLFSTVSVLMIEKIYSQQNVYQLGICPLLCTLVTNCSMEQYGTLGPYLYKCVCLRSWVCLCVVCFVTICSHRNRKPWVTSGLNLFRRQNWVVSLLISHNNKCSETNSRFHSSTVLPEPLFHFHWACFDEKWGEKKNQVLSTLLVHQSVMFPLTADMQM